MFYRLRSTFCIHKNPLIHIIKHPQQPSIKIFYKIVFIIINISSIKNKTEHNHIITAIK